MKEGLAPAQMGQDQTKDFAQDVTAAVYERRLVITPPNAHIPD
jgi:hypothetical protein